MRCGNSVRADRGPGGETREGAMTRSEFEKEARRQNIERGNERATTRTERKPCEVEIMFAFGGVPYCRAHGVMGPCPYAGWQS